MFHNIGKVDRIVRVTIAIILATLYFTNVLEGSAGTVSIAVAGLLLFTSLQRCCPVYALLGLGTCQVKSDKSRTKVETKEYRK